MLRPERPQTARAALVHINVVVIIHHHLFTKTTPHHDHLRVSHRTSTTRSSVGVVSLCGEENCFENDVRFLSWKHAEQISDHNDRARREIERRWGPEAVEKRAAETNKSTETDSSSPQVPTLTFVVHVESTQEPVDPVAAKLLGASWECPVCLQPPLKTESPGAVLVLSCGNANDPHCLCVHCFEGIMGTGRRRKCPLCRDVWTAAKFSRFRRVDVAELPLTFSARGTAPAVPEDTYTLYDESGEVVRP